MDPASLAQVESLCDIFYTKQNSPEWANANARILTLQSSAEYIPHCQYILDNSSNGYALLLASTALTKLITTHWNNFSVPQHIDIRNYILGYLANKNQDLQDFVSKSLIQLVCRLTKLGWFDDQQHREITHEVNKFLVASVDHCVIGLRILNQLVDELNIPISGKTLTQHRKTAVSFRDTSLLDMFKMALNILQQLQLRAVQGSQEQEASMGELGIGLVVKCLSFDFIGTNPDESVDDVSTIQVPSSWRDVVQDPATMTLLLFFYRNTEPPRSSRAMEALILLSSVRRSLFRSDKERSVFLGQMMGAVRDILSTQQGLSFRENYHEFCRLLGRLKSNYQLSELVRTESYLQWLDLAANFSITSFEQWQWSSNSIHYILQLWSRLVAAVPYISHPDPAQQGNSSNPNHNHLRQLEHCTVRVLQAYIKAMIDSVQQVAFSDGAIEDPLEQEGSLKEQLERIPLVFRFQYAPMAQFLIGLMDPCMQHYQELLGMVGQSAQPSLEVSQRIQVIEGQLTWMCYMIGAIMGGISWNSTAALTNQDGEESIDASLARRCFQLAQGIDFRLSQSNGTGKANERLEVAILFFFQNFRKVYMVDPSSSSMGMSGLHASILMTGSTQYEAQNRTSLKQKATHEMLKQMGLGDQTQVVNTVLTKIGNNLKYWGDAEEVLTTTLALFLEMANGGTSGKLLMNLEPVQFLIQNHTADHFPFLTHPQNYKHRTTFHATLARLIFHQTADDLHRSLTTFMEPTLQVLTQLNATADLRDASVRQALMGVFRDLRGITQATTNKRTYSMLFEMLYPRCFPIFTRAAETWFDDPDLTTSLLKFLNEFVNNKAQRVNFDNSSPNGILLFRETSSIIVAYGTRILHHPIQNPNKIYNERYKGMSLALLALTVALSGNYVNFGVFALYDDKALENALEVALQIILFITIDDVMAFPKLSRHYFAFLDVLFRSHLAHVAKKDTHTFMRIMTVMHEGLQSLDPPMSTYCASAMDHLASYLFHNRNKETPAVHQLNAHIQMDPTLLPSLTATLFNQLLFGTCLSISKPVSQSVSPLL